MNNNTILYVAKNNYSELIILKYKYDYGYIDLNFVNPIRFMRTWNGLILNDNNNVMNSGDIYQCHLTHIQPSNSEKYIEIWAKINIVDKTVQLLTFNPIIFNGRIEYSSGKIRHLECGESLIVRYNLTTDMVNRSENKILMYLVLDKPL